MMKYVFVCLLSGCATQPYWTKSAPVFPAEYLITVEHPCGQKWGGCYNIPTRTIEIVGGEPLWKYLCKLRHEVAHTLGWRHPLNMAFTDDCGPEVL